MLIETGKYLITAKQESVEQQLPAVLLVDEYDGWLKFHCTFARGAFALLIKRDDRQWLCENSNWKIKAVRMLTQAEYQEALRALVEAQQQPKKARRRASMR